MPLSEVGDEYRTPTSIRRGARRNAGDAAGGRLRSQGECIADLRHGVNPFDLVAAINV